MWWKPKPEVAKPDPAQRTMCPSCNTDEKTLLIHYFCRGYALYRCKGCNGSIVRDILTGELEQYKWKAW